MRDTMQILFGLFGGLAIFIFGMNMMSESLQKVAGAGMKKIISALTRNPVLGVIAGAITTAVLQSSSATTVMVIGFVSAGLMNLPQAISVILGANIGTTMTAQIIAFKISDYIYVFVFVGFLLSFTAKTEKVRNIGETIFAFGLLFTGIETMSSVMKPLASSPIFVELIGKVSHIPVLGVLLGTVMTLVVQSSSATIAVLQNFASQSMADGVTSIIGLTGAIPILLGDNIGTTITALLASIGQSRNARRTAAAHSVFNISGALLFIWIVKPYAALIRYISPKGPEVEVIARQIANAHTVFNITMTIIWVPLIWVMVKIVMKLIPEEKEEQKDVREPAYLDDSFVSRPPAALALTAREVLRCGHMTLDMLKDEVKMIAAGDYNVFSGICEQEENVHYLNGKITEYLARLFASGTLNEDQATCTARMMYVLGDVDRMAELCREVGSGMYSEDKGQIAYSKEAKKELENSLEYIQKMYGQVISLLENEDREKEEGMQNRKEQITALNIEMSKNHMFRVNQGLCSAEMTGPFVKMVHGIDKMGDVCSNLLDAAASGMRFSYFLNAEEG